MAMLSEHERVDSQQDLESIRKRLQSNSPTIREEADAHLGRLSAADLIKLMEIEQGHRHARKRRLVLGIFGYIGLTLLLTVVFHAWHMFNFIGIFGGSLAAAMAFSPAHKNAARALAKYDDTAGVGPLIEALEIPDADVHSVVCEGLIRLLPRLRASDAALLGTAQRRILRLQMSARPPAKGRDQADRLMEAVLAGLQQVGDETFLEPVQNIAEGHGYGTSATVRAAAQTCLPFLLQRIEYQRLSHDLLRAAGEPEQNPDVLLRAAEASGHSEPAQLLRPTTLD